MASTDLIDQDSKSPQYDIKPQQIRATPTPAGLLPNLFDIVADNGIIFDPNVMQKCDDLTRDAAFIQLAEEVLKIFQGSPLPDEGIATKFDALRYYSARRQVSQNPQFTSLGERFLNTSLQNPRMSGLVKDFSNTANIKTHEKLMVNVKDCPTSLVHILKEICNVGPAAWMKYGNDHKILQKLLIDRQTCEPFDAYSESGVINNSAQEACVDAYSKSDYNDGALDKEEDCYVDDYTSDVWVG